MADDPKRDAKRAMEQAKFLGREASDFCKAAVALEGMMGKALENK